MANTKPLSVPVLPGVREDLSEHVAPLGTLRVAKNVRFPYQGEVQCRRGTRALAIATSAAITYASLAGAGPEYLAPCPGGFMFGSQGLGFRYDLDKNRVHVAGSYGNALPKGKLTTIAREELSVSSNTPTPFPLSQATASGYVAVLHSINEGGGVNPETNGWICQVFTEGGTLVATFQQFAIGNATAGWVLADDSTAGTFVVLKRDGTALQAAIITVSDSGATMGAFSTVGTLTGASGYWAVCNWPGVGWALTYQSGATTITIRKMQGLTSVASTTLTNTGSQPMSVYCDSTHLYHGYVDVNFLGDCLSRATVYSTALVVTAGTQIVYTDTAIPTLSLTPPLFGRSTAGAQQAFLLVGRSLGAGGSVSSDLTRPMLLTATGTLTTPGTDGDIHGVLPLTAPFNAGMFWGRLQIGNVGPSRNILLDFARDRLGNAARLLNPKVALVTDSFYAPSSNTTWWGGYYLQALATPARLNDGTWVVGLPRVVRNETGGIRGFALSEWLLFETEARRAAPLASGMVLVPGEPVISDHPFGTNLDGAFAAQEYGLDVGIFGPTIISATPSVGAGSLTASSQFQYRAVVERIDSRGRRLRSEPSPVMLQSTGVGQNTMTLSLGFPANILRRYARVSSAGDPALDSRYVVHVYRTEANGQNFFRCTPAQGAPIVPNGTTTFVDLLDDASILTREDIYTDGGVLDNNHPPSCRIIKATEDRYWLAGLWDREQAQSSKFSVPGEPPQFSDSPAFRVAVPDELTGIAFQDGITIFFTAQGIYAVQGGGPSDQGQGAWDTPRCITRSTGCVNDLSILETSAGIFFQSARGLELLPRGLGEPRFVGAAVQRSFDVTEDSITGCAVITSDETRTARFCNGTVNVLTFDLDSGAWAVDEYPFEIMSICDTEQGAVLALVSNTADGYGFLLEDGSLTVDAEGAAGEAPIASELEWNAIRPYGVAGWGRFNNVVGLFDAMPSGYTNADASLFVHVDNANDVGTTFSMSGLDAPGYRAHIQAVMNGTAARLRLTTAGHGWRFMGWTLDIDDSHGGSRRVNTGERG
jgi:hypothetical protein